MPRSRTLTHQASSKVSHAQLDMQASRNQPPSTKCSTITENSRSLNLAMGRKTRSTEKSTLRTTTSQGLGQPTPRTLRGYTQAHMRKAGYLKLVEPADMSSSIIRLSKWTSSEIHHTWFRRATRSGRTECSALSCLCKRTGYPLKYFSRILPQPI